MSFPITGAALSEAGATLPALRTLDLEALSAPDLILSGGFPALVSTRLGFYSTAAHFCTIEHRTVRAVTAFFGPLTEPLDGRKHLAISCAALEVLIVREVHRWRGDVRFASAIWAPNLRKIELPKEADVTSALWAAADVEELVIHVHSSEVR